MTLTEWFLIKLQKSKDADEFVRKFRRIDYFFSCQKLVRMNRFRRQKLVFFNIGMLYMGFFVIFSRNQRRPSIFGILRVKMVSKRFGNIFDYFKKFNILCQYEDTIKFCRKFAINRCITTLYSSTDKNPREFSFCPQIGNWPKYSRLRKHGNI